MTDVALKTVHQVIACSSHFKANVIIVVINNLSVVIDHLLDGPISNPKRSVARAAPSSITGGKVAALRVKVCAEDPVFCSKELLTFLVQTEPAEFGPAGFPVPSVLGPRCEKVGKSILVKVRIAC
jgi:hypothetical protein